MKAEEIKLLRLKLGMSQQEFAVKLGATIPCIYRWESGLPPSKMAMKLLHLLKDGKL